MELQDINALVLAASTLLGVKPLPTKVVKSHVFWAQTCNSCETRRFNISESLLSYGEPNFVKFVITHEVCHVALGHNGSTVLKLGTVEADKQADICARRVLGWSELLQEFWAARAETWERNQRRH